LPLDGIFCSLPPKNSNFEPFRKADLDNLPLQQARNCFLDQLALYTPVLETLLKQPLAAWDALPSATKAHCNLYGWAAISYLSSTAVSDIPETDQPLVAFHSALVHFSRQHDLLLNGDAVAWAMESALVTLDHYARRPTRQHAPKWIHGMAMHQCYPARTESGWAQAGTGLPEQEIFTILVEIPPKQPTESFKAFATRFNKICRQAREEYILRLKNAKWETRPPYSGFEWIDRFARWQAGRKAS
jgi:hypothetical protein